MTWLQPRLSAACSVSQGDESQEGSPCRVLCPFGENDGHKRQVGQCLQTSCMQTCNAHMCMLGEYNRSENNTNRN